MKRIFILVTVVLLSAGLFAEEAILIDFSKVLADIHVKIADSDEDTTPNQNRATMMDYSNVAGGSFTSAQKNFMKTSLAIANWEVILASSSQTVTAKSLTFAQEADSQKYGKVMGLRVNFPVEPFNSWARVKPPFDIPAYEPQGEVQDDGTVTPTEDGGNGITGPSRFEDGFGVVKNVGTVKSVAVNAYGLNFPHALYAVLVHNDGTEQSVFMGYLNYDGWGELTWNNPSYVSEVRNRTLRIYPVYPASSPFVKFGGFIVQRDAAKEGGDFIGYFKDVKIIYDKAVLDTTRDIDDEYTWGIIQKRETARKKFEMERFGQNQVLRYLEAQKQAQETDFTPTPDNSENQ
ncbi:flagellar filament outer layer protein [Spirochaetia bacterium]|nr:flagellar filament outer layer protein [Spirochaetia bacterium]